MSADTADAGTDGFEVEVVTTEAEVAEATRSRRANAIHAILEETDCVAIRFPNAWWGNETFGHWTEWFFVHPDGVSPSGKALFVREGIPLSDAVNYWCRAESIVNDDHTGYTSKAARKFRRKAFNWFDDSARPGPGTLPTDDRNGFTDASCPLSVIETAIRTPADEDNTVFVPADVDNWDPRGHDREGAFEDADIDATEIRHTEYGEKVALHGDTYDAFKAAGVADEITFHGADNRWEEAHHTFNGDCWVADRNAFYWTVVPALLEAGFSVAVDADVHTACLKSWNAALNEVESGWAN